MRFPFRSFSLFALFASVALASTPEEWVANFQRYAAQKTLSDTRDLSRSEEETTLVLKNLIRELPEPSEWPALHRMLVDAADKSAVGIEQQRLRAASWLVTYLLGQREALLANLPAVPTDHEQWSPQTYALKTLRESLTGRNEEEPSPVKQLEAFEKQLTALEPVDVDALKQALGEEKFARVRHIVEIGKAIQIKTKKLLAEYQATKDEAAAQEKMGQLNDEYLKAIVDDREALGESLRDPRVVAYINQEFVQERPRQYVPSIQVPDLVALTDAKRAEQLLRRAIRLWVKLDVSERTGNTTKKLARELLLENIDKLPAPSWTLANDVETGAFFEALRRRFPDTEHDYEYTQASGYYLAGLISAGRVKEAVEFASEPKVDGDLKLPDSVISGLERSDRAAQVWDFLASWLRRHPATNEWDRFNRLSATLSRTREMRAMLKEMAAEGAFVGKDRIRVQRMEADAELASDDLAEGAARLRELIQSPAANADELKAQLELADKLLKILHLQKDGSGFAGALSFTESSLEKLWAQAPADALGVAASLAETLNATGHFEDSARIGRATLARVPELEAKAADQKEGVPTFYFSDFELQNLLGEQLRSSVELERWADAEQLIETGAYWGGKDVADLYNGTVGSNRRPLGYYFARVAQHRGDRALARRILETQLAAEPGADCLYENYLELVGPESRGLLAKLVAADRYEERPLIWRAKLELDAGDWEKAIATLQQAIGIDPSDGEEGPGDRMRVYAFMSRALAAKGDAEKSAFFANVVKSIRVSETADRWYDVGAYTRAISLYREALGFFQDAYCIQSRLAVRLAADGKMDEAAEHYRRAFELMPDSFGRVESHCFGCEHVFEGERSQSVAEKTFAQMLQARPDKPQLHYLMGYLRDEQERSTEAAEHFRKAVELDPLYLNAWSRLSHLQTKLKASDVERDNLAFKLIELDPAGQHATPDFSRVNDLARLWTAMQTAQRVLADLPRPSALWELKATAQRLSGKSGGSASRSISYREPQDFAAALFDHRFVEGIREYLGSLNVPADQN